MGLELAPSSASVTLKRVVNGTTTTLATTAGAQAVGTGKQWLRIQAAAGQVKYRIWKDGAAEPQTWTAQTAVGAALPAGQVHLSLVRGSAASARSIAVDGVTLRTVPSGALPEVSPPTAPGTPTATTATVNGFSGSSRLGVQCWRCLGRNAPAAGVARRGCCTPWRALHPEEGRWCPCCGVSLPAAGALPLSGCNKAPDPRPSAPAAGALRPDARARAPP